MLLLPSGPWGPKWQAFEPGKGSDPVEMFGLLAEQGIGTKLIDPKPWPWNPFGRQHEIFQGLDPARALQVLTLERNCDLVLAVSESSALPLLLARRLLRFRAAIVIGDPGLTETWWIRKRMLDLIVPRVDAIIVISSSQVDFIREHWKTDAMVEFIPMHVDTSFFTPAAAEVDSYILSVGDDVGRDFDTLLKALEGVDVPVVIKSRYNQFDRRKYPNIKLIPERLPDIQFRRIYEMARFVVVPLTSMITASGVNTVLEAMAMGKAVIAGDSPGIRDYVVQGETGIRVPCKDAMALRQAILQLLNDSGTCRRLGENGRRFVEQNCSHRAIAARVGDTMWRVVHKRQQLGYASA
jgi:glycosyltransferase involved in cell wall biosynthesis